MLASIALAWIILNILLALGMYLRPVRSTQRLHGTRLQRKLVPLAAWGRAAHF